MSQTQEPNDRDRLVFLGCVLGLARRAREEASTQPRNVGKSLSIIGERE